MVVVRGMMVVVDGWIWVGSDIRQVGMVNFGRSLLFFCY
jgi:hypothetical protein